MSYTTVAAMQQSAALLSRCTAAVADEVAAGNSTGDSSFAASWVATRSWDFASTPGWSDQWESAIAAGNTDPGASHVVITDNDILARVQGLLSKYPLPQTPVG